jgi:hypothetical protein
MVSSAHPAKTTTRAGTWRRISRIVSATGDSETAGSRAARRILPPKKNPDNARKTSTPPDTRPNQMWNMATSAIAIPRKPSRSYR